jgi:branched-chain amino acid transport system ATP-binding protein
MTDVEPILVADSLSSGYGDIQVLWGASVTVWPGRISVLLGSNGAGKSTMLRTISGLNRATSGRVTYRGRDITGESAPKRARDGIAYVMEGKRLFHARTVEENLMLGGYTRSRSRRTLRGRAGGIYEKFPMLGERRSVRAGALSGGQQQMLAIGQALMSEPAVLMLDEPSGGLAPAIVKDVFRIVEELRAEGLGVLLVEQAAEQALAIADHVTVLNVGKVVIDRPADQVEDVSVIRSAYLGMGDLEAPGAEGGQAQPEDQPTPPVDPAPGDETR